MWDKALECFAVINECEDVSLTEHPARAGIDVVRLMIHPICCIISR